ncbi:MAG: nuclear transport factor 2 family protein [Solirubrobacterales bacterium]
MPRSLTDCALQFVSAFNEGDLDGFNEVLHPDVEIHSNRGLREGRDAARAWATRAPGGVQQTVEVGASSESGAEVLLEIERHWHWDEDGSHAATDEMAWLFGFRDGLVSSWRPFEDREEAIRAFESKGQYPPEPS